MKSNGLEKILLGAPFTIGTREETAFDVDQHNAPAVIRKSYYDLMTGFDIPQHFKEGGDILGSDTLEGTLSALSEAVYSNLSTGHVPILLGGAHTITLGALRGLHKFQKDYSLIYFDAHPDIMPHPTINYGSSLYYAIKEGLVNPKRLALLGIRQVEQAEWKLINEMGIYHQGPLQFEKRGAEQILQEILAKFPPPYALSIDLDGVDPAFCPGVTTPYPGGLTLREVIYISSKIAAMNLIYADIVELSPRNDNKDGVSARFAAALLHEIAGAY